MRNILFQKTTKLKLSINEKKCEDLVDLDRQPGQVRITNILRGVTVCSDTVGWTGAQIHVGDSLATQ